MPEPDTSLPVVYPLRVVLRGISPLIWRRLLVAGDTSIAGLHDVLQVATRSAASARGGRRTARAGLRPLEPGPVRPFRLPATFSGATPAVCS